MANLSNTKQWLVVAGVTAALMAAGPALAGSGGETEFGEIYTQLEDWAKGTLGKVLAMAMFIVGIGMGIVRQSVMAAVTGIGGALVLSYGPTVIGGIFTALV